MIARPLDLASRLRPAPRSLDALFFVNAGLLVFFFSIFGSPLVLQPALAVDFQLPQVNGANTDARPATHFITVMNAGQILAGDGVRTPAELRTWLLQQATLWNRKPAKSNAPPPPPPTLLVLASSRVELAVMTDIAGAARAAGFDVLVAATEPTAAPSVSAPAP